ncbi:AraC family transcriptional regulator [Chishuiella sp.]|uniref:AraC family transcriptional regulator n=1 Tax=Chishuiella sp. TaxID=1969467 RepID=UPI0028A84DB7|nr:AraC family transcriptional regulator [Chishuiella sp.]
MLNTDYFPDINNEEVDFYIRNLNSYRIEVGTHEHNKSQLLYAEGGIIHIFINGKHWYLPARCFIWIPAFTPHSILSYSKSVDMYNFYFKTEIDEGDFYKEYNIYYADDLLREMFLFTKKWNGAVTSNDIVKYNFLKTIKSILPEMESSKIPVILQHAFPKDKKLLEIADYLRDNLEKNLTIDDIAKKFGLSSRTLSRKFKDGLGINYVRFLRSLRITRSLELISKNQFNMYEIAMLVGYNSLSSFSNVFYKVTGIRPTEYSKITQKKK